MVRGPRCPPTTRFTPSHPPPEAASAEYRGGTYVDYLCSDGYSLTLSAPVEVETVSRGWPRPTTICATSRRPVLPLLRQLPGPAHLVNARGRGAASADPAHLAGSLTKGPGFAAVPEEGGATRFHGTRLIPCRGVPLVLVISAADEAPSAT